MSITGIFKYQIDFTGQPVPSDSSISTNLPIINTGGSFTSLSHSSSVTGTILTVTVPFTYIDKVDINDGLTFKGNANNYNKFYNGFNSITITEFGSIPLSRGGGSDVYNGYQFGFLTNIVFESTSGNPTILSSTSLRGCFYCCTNFNSNMNDWNTSNVTDMMTMFSGATQFNSDISGWDTSNVTNMSYMFYNASVFDQDISSWNTSNVTYMSYMFAGYNNTITTLNVNTNFNNGGQPLDTSGNCWDTSNVTDMSYMFSYNSKFNVSINNWDTSNVAYMSYMFYIATLFNQDISSWNTSKVTSMEYMFSGCSSFNQNIGSWDTGLVTTMSAMFGDCITFNQSIDSWNTGLVTTMGSMFFGAGAFNQDLNSWNTSNVTTMDSMFANANAFNGDISSWDTSKVTDMSSMFYNATAFNQNLSNWKTHNVTNMAQMFENASNFNNSIIKNITLFTLCTCPKTNFNGAAPDAAVIYQDGILYGTTAKGGNNNLGTIFSYDLSSNIPTVIHSFNGTDGSNPWAAVIYQDGILYGTINETSTNDIGILFSFDLSSNTLTTLYSFSKYEFGGFAISSTVIYQGGILYGGTSGGSEINRYGALFSFDLSSNTLTTLHSFDETDGSSPQASLIYQYGILYGTTAGGGINRLGTIFSYDLASNTLTTLHSFDGPNGRYPASALAYQDGILYGTTSRGWEYSSGILYSYNLPSNRFTILYSFKYSEGAPFPAVIYQDGMLYGTLYGGELYSYNLSSNTLTTLHSFDITGSPQASLIYQDGILYGSTASNSTSYTGTLFGYTLMPWNTSNNASFVYMFYGATSFNANLYNWNTDNAKHITNFEEANNNFSDLTTNSSFLKSEWPAQFQTQPVAPSISPQLFDLSVSYNGASIITARLHTNPDGYINSIIDTVNGKVVMPQTRTNLVSADNILNLTNLSIPNGVIVKPTTSFKTVTGDNSSWLYLTYDGTSPNGNLSSEVQVKTSPPNVNSMPAGLSLRGTSPTVKSYPVTVSIKRINVPISNICFVGNTPIVCDQGTIPIRSIQPDIHTIFNKKIVAITQTITDDKYLVCFEKDSLGKNLPAKKTVMTPHHKIMYKKKLVMAGYFLGHFKGVSKVPYSGEVLYNVLMENHELIVVNNMLTETLHPKNVIARLYNNPMLTESAKKAMIETMNDCWVNKKTDSYKKLVSRL